MASVLFMIKGDMPRRPNAHREEGHPGYSDKQGLICIHLHKSDEWA